MSLQVDRSPSRSSHDSARATIVQPEPVPEKDDSERDYEKRDDADEQVASEESDDRQTAEPAAGVDDYPEGGLKAWLVVLGAACVTCATFGFINSWELTNRTNHADLAQYLNFPSQASFSPYTKRIYLATSSHLQSWIGSIQYSLVFFPGLLTGRMFDLGWYRIPQLFWSIVLVVAVFLVAECTKYWHFVLVQGIMLGLASGCLFGPVMAVLTHWFKKRRSLAFGIVAVGSAFGGTVFPIAARRLKDEIGFAWSLRVMGFMILILLGIANLTLHRRLPPVHVSGGLFNFAAFKSVAFSSYCASSFFAFFGIYAVLTYLDVGAISHGVSPEFSFYLISIANASSAVGRLASGVMGDRIGAVNTLIPCTLFAAIMTYIWPYAHTQSSLIAVAVLYGFASGTYVSLLVVPIAHMGDHGDVGRRTGMANTILAIGALAGPPTSGAIATATGSYNALGAFAGSMVVLSCLCMLVTKWAMTGHLLRGKF